MGIDRRTLRRSLVVLALYLPLTAVAGEQARATAGTELVNELRRGGCVLVMRHASSPRTPPDASQVNTDNMNRERQLDLSGRISATAMGAAMRQMHIVVGSVLASPAYRALETVRLGQFGAVNTYPQLAEPDGGIDATASEARSSWLRAQAAVRPASGTNTIIVTQLPNISGAFPQYSEQLTEGEALVFRPDNHGAADLVGRIKIDEWPALAALR